MVEDQLLEKKKMQVFMTYVCSQASRSWLCHIDSSLVEDSLSYIDTHCRHSLSYHQSGCYQSKLNIVDNVMEIIFATIASTHTLMYTFPHVYFHMFDVH